MKVKISLSEDTKQPHSRIQLFSLQERQSPGEAASGRHLNWDIYVPCNLSLSFGLNNNLKYFSIILWSASDLPQPPSPSLQSIWPDLVPTVQTLTFDLVVNTWVGKHLSQGGGGGLGGVRNSAREVRGENCWLYSSRNPGFCSTSTGFV